MHGVSIDPNYCSIWIGWDTREGAAWAVAAHTIKKRLSLAIEINALVLSDLQEQGLYTREVTRLSNKLYDPISQAPMSTEFAISRFLVPYLHINEYGKQGWALFIDCDMLARADIVELFNHADDRYAVMCVKHNHKPVNQFKMDKQVQTVYDRKNWSSVMLFNMAHPAHDKLTLQLVNSVPGRDLHAFCWLNDDEIGSLDPAWNHLVGHSTGSEPKLVHFTEGMPYLTEYENVPYADEWRAAQLEAMHGRVG